MQVHGAMGLTNEILNKTIAQRLLKGDTEL